MRTLSVPAPKIEADSMSTTVSAQVTVNNKRYDIWYKVPKGTTVSKEQASDGLLCLLLIPAMKSAERLSLTSPVSAKILESTEVIQDMYTSWHSDKGFKRVKIDAKARTSASKPAPARGVASCFTAGVDSFYSLLRHKSEITHLIYIHGFDIPLKEVAFRKKVSKHLNEVAKSLGKELVEPETNIQELTNDIAEWGEFSHGFALASVALLLASNFRKLYAPSSLSYADLYPRGTHALLDPLWSSEYLSFVHDGAEATRIQKVDYISSSKEAMEHLRVCWQSNDAYNCSVCEKCVRTMTSLEIVGALQKCQTFSRKLTTQQIRDLNIKNNVALSYAEESLKAAKNNHTSPEIISALSDSIDNYKNMELSILIKDRFNAFVGSPYFNDVKDQIISTLWAATSKSLIASMPSQLSRKVRSKLGRSK